MSEAEKLRIEAILSEMADESPSSELLAELESLLRERPDLQHHYAQVMRLHTHLAYEFDLLTQRHTPVLPLPQLLEQLIATDAQATTPSEKESSRPDTTPLGHIRRACTTFFRMPFTRPWAIAALLLVSLGIVGLIWQARRHQDFPVVDTQTGLNSTWHGDLPHDSEQLVVRDANALATLGRLSNTTVPTSLALPRVRSSSSTKLTLCSGTAWVARGAKNVERSVVVTLPPQEEMEIYVDTEAEAQNSLSLIELDSHGRANGQTLAFDNLVQDDAVESNRRIGSIGKMSEINSSRSTRYFLLTGSHIPREQSPAKEIWQQSDFRILVESQDMMVIGWDDSGYVPDEATIDDSQRDFNDVRAVVRFRGRKTRDPKIKQGIAYFPRPSSDRPSVAIPAENAQDGSSYDLEVKPGQELLLMISRASRERSIAEVIEMDSEQVVWKLPLSFDRPTPTSAGTYLIKNNGDKIARYRLRVLRAGGEDGKSVTWKSCIHRELPGDKESKSVGFQESANAPWIDVYVHARWFSNTDTNRLPPSDLL